MKLSNSKTTHWSSRAIHGKWKLVKLFYFAH